MKNVCAKKIVDLVWDNFNYYRDRNENPIVFFFACLNVLYGFIKGYELDPNGSGFYTEERDEILSQLHLRSGDLLFRNVVFPELYQQLTELPFPKEEIIYEYKYALQSLIEKFSIVCGRYSSLGFYTPSDISSLIAHFVVSEGCKTVYDPFCGTSNIVFPLASQSEYQIEFEGQDCNADMALLSRMVIDATNGRYDSVKQADSLWSWSRNHYDAVVSCPPYGMMLNQESSMPYQSFDGGTINCVEDLIFSNTFILNRPNLAIFLLPLRFCFSQKYYRIRKYLIDENYLDSVVSLPANLLSYTSMQMVLVVCKKHRDYNEPVNFYFADSFVIGNGRFDRKLDLPAFYANAFNGNRTYYSAFYREGIRENQYIFTPRLYSQTLFTYTEDQRIVQLKDIITECDKTRRKNNLPSEYVPYSRFKSSLINILLNENSTEEQSDKQKLKSAVVLEERNMLAEIWINSMSTSLLYVHTTDKPCSVDAKVTHVYKINTDLVTPAYLVYLLTANSIIKEGQMSLNNYLGMFLVIDQKDKQDEIIARIKQEYKAKMDAERDADAKRLGIKTNISDLEHMLGATQDRIGSIISRLERITPDSERYKSSVKDLKDNFQYMNRMITYSNSNIDISSFNLKKTNLSELVKSYSEAWKNYGGPYFELEIEDNLDNASVYIDKTMFTVMLDSILNNAVRHSFHKDKFYTERNTVCIRLSKVEYKGSAYALISVSNNGDPIREDFSIQDYISRGRYSADTGHSGLGGYHVFQVVKGHNGFLNLDSTKMWNVIVNILFPIKEDNVDQLTPFENECI